MKPFSVYIQNKETAIALSTSRYNMDMVIPHIIKLHPRARIRKVGTHKVCLRMKMSKVQQQTLMDYLNFVFN